MRKSVAAQRSIRNRTIGVGRKLTRSASEGDWPKTTFWQRSPSLALRVSLSPHATTSPCLRGEFLCLPTLHTAAAIGLTEVNHQFQCEQISTGHDVTCAAIS